MKNIKKWMAAAGVGLTLLTATVTALPAAAADTAAVAVQRGGGPVGGGAGETYLAEALGITAAELQTAQQTANEAAVDQALADGLITQAQADALKARGGSFGRGFQGFFGVDDTAIDMDALLADALGISADELAAARIEAQDLALSAAVEDGRLTQEHADQMKAEQALKTYLDEQDFQTQVQTLYENLVQQAVQAGVITQAQADTILSDSHGFGGVRGFGGPGGMHGPRGGGPAGLFGPAGAGMEDADL